MKTKNIIWWRKKKDERTNKSEKEEKKKEKKKEQLKNSGDERKVEKKEKKNGQKLRLTVTSGSLHVCLITKIPLETELWKLKTHFMCFQFP